MASPANKLSVVVRVRPMGHAEVPGDDAEAVAVGGDGSVIVSDRGVSREWSFRSVLGPDATQVDAFSASGLAEAVDGTRHGRSSCVLCHGATGSGKTHTMLGRPGRLDSLPRLAGLLPRALAGLFRAREEVEAAGGSQSLLLGAVDVYQEAVYDLLAEGTPRLAVRHQAETGAFFAAGAAWRELDSPADAESAVALAVRQRVTGQHAANAESSRSHAVFTVMVSTSSAAGGESSRAVLVLVDLAGSERRKRTEASGRMADESSAINTSLLALNRVVMALAAAGADADAAVVPYRSSVLTRLLRAVLSGPGRVVLVACVSPAESQVDHTLATLQYAARATGIRARSAAREPAATRAAGGSAIAAGAAAELREAREEVARLRAENASLRVQLLRAGVEPLVLPSAPALGATAAAADQAILEASGGDACASVDEAVTAGEGSADSPREAHTSGRTAGPERHARLPASRGFVPAGGARAGAEAEAVATRPEPPRARPDAVQRSRASKGGTDGRAGRSQGRKVQSAASRTREDRGRPRAEADELGRLVKREAELLAVDFEAALHARQRASGPTPASTTGAGEATRAGTAEPRSGRRRPRAKSHRRRATAEPAGESAGLSALFEHPG